MQTFPSALLGGVFSATDVQGFVELMPRLDEGLRWEPARNREGEAVLRLYRGAVVARASRRSKPCES